MAEAVLFDALAGCAREDLGGWGMRVFFQEVVLDLPRVVVAEAIGEFHLVERVLIELAFVVHAPWAWQLQLVEDAKLSAFPGAFPCWSRCYWAVGSP